MDDYNEDATAHQSAPLPDAEERAEYSEMRVLFDQAAATLSEKERNVYELAVRHNLSSGEIAKVLGVRPAYAYILVNRLKTSVAEAAEAVLLARVGAERCADLAQLLQTTPVSSRGRKAIVRHSKTCATCGETKRRRASLPALMQGVAYAEPGHHFRTNLRGRIDGKWAGASGAGAAAAGASALITGVVAVLVVTGAMIAGAAQRTITGNEPSRPAVVKTTTPGPTAAPTAAPSDEAPAGDSGPALVEPSDPQPQTTGQVIVVNGSSEGVTTGTSDSSSSSSGGTTRHPNPQPSCCDKPRQTPPSETQPPIG